MVCVTAAWFVGLGFSLALKKALQKEHIIGSFDGVLTKMSEQMQEIVFLKLGEDTNMSLRSLSKKSLPGALDIHDMAKKSAFLLVNWLLPLV